MNSKGSRTASKPRRSKRKGGESAGTPPTGLTRRQWLLRLGEAAVLIGFRGEAEEVEATWVSPAHLTASGLSKLPPGLYDPSNEHLRHALSSESRFHPIPAGTETDYVRPATTPFKPQFFSPQEFQIVRRMVELTLGEMSSEPPRSGTGSEMSIADEVARWLDFTVFHSAALREAALRLAPEHRTLAIHYYGLANVRDLETRDPQKTCREGLRWLAEQSERRNPGGFLGLGEDDQIALLKQISDDRSDKTLENDGTRFFHLIKSEVIRGFYTSQAGLKELDYKGNSFYAESPGCPGHNHSN